MIVNEDGGVTGSVDVSKLDEIEPKTDEARAQVEALKADRDAGQTQADVDAARLAEQARAQDPMRQDDDAGADTRDAQGKELEGRPQGGSLQQADGSLEDADRTSNAGEPDLDSLRAEAEKAGVTVDKRWGADRLRQETEQARSSSRRSGKQG